MVELLNHSLITGRGKSPNPREGYYPPAETERSGILRDEATVPMTEEGHMSTQLQYSPQSRIKRSSSNTGPKQLENAVLASGATRGKGRLSDKYLAGLLDSDGSIMLMWNPPCRRENWDGTGPQRAYVVVAFSQKTGDMDFMRSIANSLTPPSLPQVWGSFGTRSDTDTQYWKVAGTKATSVLMRLKKYLVCKRNVAEVAIEMNGQIMDVAAGKAQLEAARAVLITPKHPTRKWAAGYIDGNGSFDVRVPKGMAGQPILSVSDEAKERNGVELLHKAFGGSIQESVTPNGTPMVYWVLSMDAAKCRSIFENTKTGLGKHMMLKTDQVYFLLGCAKMGHFRDGERIRNALYQLRIQPHRLNGPGAQVATLLKTVRDVPSFMGPGAAERKRKWDIDNS